MAEFVGEYVRDWAQANVHNYPLEDKADEVGRLVDRLYEDAFKSGYEPQDIDDLRVEVRDIIEDYFEQVQDGDLGFKD